MNLFARFGSWLAALVMVLALSGCGGSGDGLPRQALSGSVTLDGSPLKDGTIQFTPVSEGQGTALTAGGQIKDGQYSVPQEQGLTPGTYKVSIYASSGEMQQPDEATGPGAAPKVMKELIPPKYNANTTLTAEVKADGDNTFNFDLKN